MRIDDKEWKVGEANRPDRWGAYRKPDTPDALRGIYTVEGEWVCDCTDAGFARDVIAGDNALICKPQTPPEKER